MAFHLQSVITITFELQPKTITIVLLFHRFANKSSVYTQLSSCQLTARHNCTMSRSSITNYPVLFFVALFFVALFFVALFFVALFFVALFFVALFFVALFYVALFFVALLFVCCSLTSLYLLQHRWKTT